MKKSLLLTACFFSSACKRPPEAPQGLDASSRYMIREFYASDEEIAAGLTGLLQWYEDEGHTLLDAEANPDNVEGFGIADLSTSDVELLPLEGERDMSLANGIVSLSAIQCTPHQTEALIVREDQLVVFDGTFEDYERSYKSSRQTFEDATSTSEYGEQDRPINTPNFDDEGLEARLLRTDNQVVTKDAGITVDFNLIQHFRHGIFDIDGRPTSAFIGLGYVPQPSTGSDTTLEQQYNIEVFVEREDMPSLRMFAMWMQVDSPVIGPDSAIWPTTSVNRAKSTAKRLNDICSNEVDVPAE